MEVEELIKQVQIQHIGTLKVFGVDIDRSQNKFIHEYALEKENEKLTYNIRTPSEKKVEIESKKQKIQKDILDNVAKSKKKESPFAKLATQAVDFLGLDSFKKKEYPILKIFGIRNALFKNIESKSHILVEDYELTLPFGIVAAKKETGEYFGEVDKDMFYRHFVRVEKFWDAKDAPSVRKQKEFIISDIDYSIRGNPHSSVKSFIS